MKTEIKKAWINQKCNECGKPIYPNQSIRVKPDHGWSNLGDWLFCEKCFNKIFSDEVKKKIK